MLLCQIEIRTLNNLALEPTYYIVGRYNFDPGLKVAEEVWVNWQIAERNFEVCAKVMNRRKEVYVDGKSVVANMSDREQAKFSAIYPDGIKTLSEGASLFLVRIFLEAKDKDVLFKIQEAMAQGEKFLAGQKHLPEPH